ncbi:unnamed protein product [Owenia fusiformis]|uniref:Uncharacterized protein n=1 Tax=Owenia fusiformis TaxID=6347 RepID=A0A8J1XET1_OWEFU|nr:unnamed protein product [Owenia fusiformis]
MSSLNMTSDFDPGSVHYGIVPLGAGNSTGGLHVIHIDEKIQGNVTLPSSSGVTPIYGATTTTETPVKNILPYVFIPLGALLFIAILSFLIIFILKKTRLDKLRHHLMPVYSFDPEQLHDEDWESELLEEDKEQQAALKMRNSPSPQHYRPAGGKLIFKDTNSLDV